MLILLDDIVMSRTCLKIAQTIIVNDDLQEYEHLLLVFRSTGCPEFV